MDMTKRRNKLENGPENRLNNTLVWHLPYLPNFPTIQYYQENLLLSTIADVINELAVR